MKVDMTNVSENTMNISDLIYKYMRIEHLPHIWCPGCGNGIILRAVAQAMENMKLERNKTVLVSGIGCSSRAAGYIDCNSIHTTHGRAIAYATGIKMAHPDYEVIVMNNNIYGMTGGQYSPTTPHREFGTTAPYGNIDQPFDIAKLAMGAGATFAARSTVYHAPQLAGIIEKGIRHKGFSVIDVTSICPTYYGRKNKKGSAVDMMKWQKENSIPVEKAKDMPEEELEGKLVVGVLRDKEAVEYSEEYSRLVDAVQGGIK